MEITVEDLEARVTKEETSSSTFRFSGEDKPRSSTFTKKFVDFSGTSKPDLIISVPKRDVHYLLHLSLDNYGFSDSRMVKIDRRGRVTGFSPNEERVYQALFVVDELSLNAALGTITDAVNNSMRYDFDELLKSEDLSPEFKTILQRDKDACQPRGDETVEGVCWSAGDLIRTLLSYTLRDPNLRYVHVPTTSGTVGVAGHDTTLVIDIKDGKWVVLNSKTPRSSYALTPIKKLPELGVQYKQLQFK